MFLTLHLHEPKIIQTQKPFRQLKLFIVWWTIIILFNEKKMKKNNVKNLITS